MFWSFTKRPSQNIIEIPDAFLSRGLKILALLAISGIAVDEWTIVIPALCGRFGNRCFISIVKFI